MSEKDFSGPAFPSETSQYGSVLGMTLRDYFAAKAMQWLCSNTEWLTVMASKLAGTGVSPDQGVSFASYEMADAMLEARK